MIGEDRFNLLYGSMIGGDRFNPQPWKTRFEKVTNIRLSESVALTHIQRSQNLNFGVFSLSLGILQVDFFPLFPSTFFHVTLTEHEPSWFRNTPLVDPWVGIQVWFPHPWTTPPCWRLDCSSREAERRQEAHGNSRRSWVCLQGSAVNEFWLHTKMWNLFSRFPCHQQHPGALEAPGQSPHSFPGVSLFKKKKENLFVVLTLWWGAGMGWLGNP